MTESLDVSVPDQSRSPGTAEALDNLLAEAE